MELVQLVGKKVDDMVTVRVAVVGGGVAGVMLAMRLRRSRPAVAVTLFVRDDQVTVDATSVSAGMVRGFDTDAEQCSLAAESMAELLADSWFTEQSGYHQIGSLYVLPPGCDPTDLVRSVNEVVPGSATATPAAELAVPGQLTVRPSETPVVKEKCAGYLSPESLRRAVLRWLRDHEVDIRVAAVREVTTDGAVVTGAGGTVRFDRVVVAAGAWTPALVAERNDMRTKRIQYAVYSGAVPGLGAFVDENSGLYGRVVDQKSLLLGRSTDEWDVVPDQVSADPVLAVRVGTDAAALFALGSRNLVPNRMFTAADCYVVSGGLRLRPVPGTEQVFTFTGGSGGAAKTVLAASRRAAVRLLDDD